MKTLFSLFLLVCLTGCTENERAKSFGGSSTVNLPSGKKLVNVTWKESNLWYLVRDMKTEDTEDTYEFHEQSSFGLLEGKVIFKESKQ